MKIKLTRRHRILVEKQVTSEDGTTRTVMRNTSLVRVPYSERDVLTWEFTDGFYEAWNNATNEQLARATTKGGLIALLESLDL